VWTANASFIAAGDGCGLRWPWRSLEDVEFAAFEWVDGFETRRLSEPIGDVPPAEYTAA
jgi:putative transposase